MIEGFSPRKKLSPTPAVIEEESKSSRSRS
jgi:hypothetical protein